MSDEKAEARKFRELRSFFKSSWIQVPDRSSDSRFMRPQYVAKSAGEEHEGQESESTNSNNGLSGSCSVSASATYVYNPDLTQPPHILLILSKMPYLSFSTHHQREKDGRDATFHSSLRLRSLEQAKEDHDKMLNAYKNTEAVLHVSSTLDEFYYHFGSDDDSSKLRDKSNKTQVVSRYLNEKNKKRKKSTDNDLEFWPLIRVNHLWMWNINNGWPNFLLPLVHDSDLYSEWLITATSPKIDDSDGSLVSEITEHLQNEAQAGNTQSEPDSAEELGRIIVDYCMGAYERKRKPSTKSHVNGATDQQDSSSQSHREQQNDELSIRQIFSNFINEQVGTTLSAL